ncbi:hypothetical protein L602_002100000130 [Cupriavidus gilardii J11]|uniref:Uncharacterized protein n=1 Tax=Cupriavidus gilardii J11 TaxID=936133 RepID=A0A562BLY7_9BURK|nr:hypothetical protein L602_002100000130 [Cupriavidus gilardii J11]
MNERAWRPDNDVVLTGSARRLLGSVLGPAFVAGLFYFYGAAVREVTSPHSTHFNNQKNA